MFIHFSPIALEQINSIRAAYEEYLQILVTKNVISKDDQATYAEVYPLFDPYYVSYDKGVSAYEDLRNVSSRIFSMEAHLKKHLHEAERVLGYELTDREKVYHFSPYSLFNVSTRLSFREPYF